VRQQELRRAPRVVADLVDAAAAGEQEPPQLRARVVEPSGRRPAVRTAEDAARAVLSASSQPISANASRPRLDPSLFARSRSQLSRTAGRATRSGECTIAGIASSIGDGAGSRAKGSQRTTRSPATTAVKAPQCESDWNRCSFVI
jgi:hypothetical protein